LSAGAATAAIVVALGASGQDVPAAAAPAATPAPVTSAPPAPLNAAPDARRLEYEREGGGSPRERQGQSQKTLTARLRRWLFGGN